MGKLSKFFKKLGKQIKTNLKHGAKYIAPVLVSAMTGGFGSGIVKSLFGGKTAGALASTGNKLFGGLLGKATGSGAANAATQAAGDSVGNVVAGGINGTLGVSGLPGISGLGVGEAAAQAANTANGVGSFLAGAAPALGKGSTLVGSNPYVAKADQALGKLAEQYALTSANGAINRKLGTVPDVQNSPSSSSGSMAKSGLLSQLKPYAISDPSNHTEGNIAGTSEAVKDRVGDGGITVGSLRAAMASEMGLSPEEVEEMEKQRKYGNRNFGGSW